jgi:glycosyltransferase involved in cell wall biosynthesis
VSLRSEELRYAVITAARNEAEHLPVLAASLRLQRHQPDAWFIVENGSNDRTLQVATELADRNDWIHLLVLGEAGPQERGAPIVRALEAALNRLGGAYDIVVNVDADVSMDELFFENLVTAFVQDPSLGIASGIAYELNGDAWEPRFVTGGTVWGATRAYRRRCLEDVLPLERRHGWDGMDQLRARSKGWATRVLDDVPFYHHRREGARDGSRWAHWSVCGESSYFMGYRPWYLLLRAAHQARREPAAVAMVWGYAGSLVRRRPRWKDEPGRAVLREDQRIGALISRRREALGASPRRRHVN